VHLTDHVLPDLPLRQWVHRGAEAPALFWEYDAGLQAPGAAVVRPRSWNRKRQTRTCSIRANVPGCIGAVVGRPSICTSHALPS
jgi:hypothetical protein